MKRIVLLLTLVSIYHINIFSQKKYEMVVEKTNGTEIVIKTDEVVRVYFRETGGNGDNDNSGKNSDLYGIWYENLEVLQGEQIVAALRIDSETALYNENTFTLLKSNPDEFFGPKSGGGPYTIEGNVIYGIRDGKKYEKSRTEYELSEDKKTLTLSGYFNGVFTKLE